MPSVTTAYAKNIIRRAFLEIIDQTPSKKDAEKVWIFFACECAYCGKKLLRENKEGHMDHLISASRGGRNHLANRVLSCATCNEKEKRDLPWEEFLVGKVSEPALLDSRREKIMKWQGQTREATTERFQDLVIEAERLANEVVKVFESKVTELKNSNRT